jgi:Transposase.
VHPSRGKKDGRRELLKEGNGEQIQGADKVVASVFWDNKGILLVEFPKRGSTVNSERYMRALK